MSQSAFCRCFLLSCVAIICTLVIPLNLPGYQESTNKQPSLLDTTTLKYFQQESVQDLMPYVAEFLNSTDEPSLLTQAQDPTKVSYRFAALLLPGMYIRVIRFSLHPDGTATVVTFLGPFPKDPTAKIKADKVERDASTKDAAEFLELVDDAGFWTMPTVKTPDLTPPKYYTLDGAMWVFEGARNGAYHVVYRGNPNASPFTDMVHFLGKNLAGLNDSEIPGGMWPPVSLLPPNQSVAIQISEPVTAEQTFAVRILNRRSKTISFCIAFAGDIASLPPVPAFDVQRLGPKKWGSLLWGSDLGPSDAPTELGSEKTQEFRMKLIAPGRYRLRLYYVPGTFPDSPGADACAKVDQLKGGKVVTSEEFEVLPNK